MHAVLLFLDASSSKALKSAAVGPNFEAVNKKGMHSIFVENKGNEFVSKRNEVAPLVSCSLARMVSKNNGCDL